MLSLSLSLSLSHSYRTALESIKKQKKQYTASAKEHALRLETARANRNTAQRVRPLLPFVPS